MDVDALVVGLFVLVTVGEVDVIALVVVVIGTLEVDVEVVEELVGDSVVVNVIVVINIHI